MVDGVVGQQTWGALNAAAPAVPPASTLPAGGGGGPVGSGVRFLQGPDFDEPSGGIFYVAENAGPTARAAFGVHDTITVSGPDGSVLFEQDFLNGDELAAGGSYGNQSIKVHNDEPGPHQVFVMLDEGRGENVSFEFTIGGPVGLSIEFVQGPDLNRPTGGVFYAAENHGTGTAAAGRSRIGWSWSAPTVRPRSTSSSSTRARWGPKATTATSRAPPMTARRHVRRHGNPRQRARRQPDVQLRHRQRRDRAIRRRRADRHLDKVRGFFELPETPRSTLVRRLGLSELRTTRCPSAQKGYESCPGAVDRRLLRRGAVVPTISGREPHRRRHTWSHSKSPDAGVVIHEGSGHGRSSLILCRPPRMPRRSG